MIAVSDGKRNRSGTVVATLLLVSAIDCAHALDIDNLWSREDQRGYELLEQGKPDEAANVFVDPQWRGISQFRSGNFQAAQEEFAKTTGDAALYNQGTAAARAGDYQGAIEMLQKLVENSPDHADARHNLEIVRKLLDNDESQQQNQDQQSSENEQENQQQDGQESNEAEGESGEQSQEQSSAQQSRQDGELSADPSDAGQQNDESAEPQGEPDDEQNGEDAEGEAQSSGSDSNDDETEGQRDDSDPSAQSGLEPGENSPGEMSENEQATEQWLRRIPDDPSQLLRNKIRLNHMIDHAEVRDMQEPW